jgi:hypothetical protein
LADNLYPHLLVRGDADVLEEENQKELVARMLCARKSKVIRTEGSEGRKVRRREP